MVPRIAAIGFFRCSRCECRRHERSRDARRATGVSPTKALVRTALTQTGFVDDVKKGQVRDRAEIITTGINTWRNSGN